MTNPMVLGPMSTAQREERAELDRRDPDESGYFHTLEEIVNRIYPQPEAE